jgi:MFS family permease
MSRLFVLVAAVTVVDAMFFGAIAPLLPEYRTDLELSKSAAGVLSASYAAGTLAGALPGGLLAVRFGVRSTVVLGLTLMASSSVAFAFATDVVVLDIARFAQGLGGACSWAAGLAWLAAESPHERRGEVLGSVLGVAIAGILLGPVLGGIATVAGPEPVFTLVGIAGAALALWASRTAISAPLRGNERLRSYRTALQSGAVRAGLWLTTLAAVFAGAVEILAPLRLDELGANGVAIGAVFLVGSAAQAGFTRYVGKVSDKRGRRAPILAGLAAMAVLAAILALPRTAVLLGLVVIAALMAFGCIWAPAAAIVSDSTEALGIGLGLSFALFNLAWAAGFMIGGSVGGALADTTTDAVPYLACVLLFTATGVALARPTWSARLSIAMAQRTPAN